MRLRRAQPNHLVQCADADAHLVAWAKQNPQAFTALYDRYFPAVYGYCLSQLTAPDAAEDATSQTFLKALAALPHYRESGRFRPWLFVIAHNVVLDALTNRRAHESLEAVSELLDPTPSPEERAIAAVDADWLAAALARLPVEDLRVLELRRAGLSGREIAEVLGISHEAAKKRQLRAIDRLRDDLVATTRPAEHRRGA
jgi:RNA polymerase sigma-70 factor (ECF subfamily)